MEYYGEKWSKVGKFWIWRVSVLLGTVTDVTYPLLYKYAISMTCTHEKMPIVPVRGLSICDDVN